MLGITFNGRFARKQFWIATIILSILSLAVLSPILKTLERDAIETGIVAGIVKEKGGVTPADLPEHRERDLNNPNYKPAEKKIFTMAYDRLEKMSESELLETYDGHLLTHDWPLFLCLIVGEIYLMIFSLSVYIRRGHDLNISGGITTILLIIPLVNLILAIYYGFFPGDFDEIEYGKSPID